MGLLDNSGDIILDVVLTDEGRRRLARGDGSFSITQFALGDDEINYALYDNSAAAGNEDIQILQTPVLEAFTNNRSSVNSRLLTLPATDLLFLTTLKLNESIPANQKNSAEGAFVVAVDKATENNNDAVTPTTAVGVDSTKNPITGVIFGATPTVISTSIRVDSGLDTDEVSPARGLESYLQETQFMIEMDNRLGTIVSANGAISKEPDFIGDDNIAVYTFSYSGADDAFISQLSNQPNAADQVIRGPRSNSIQFKIRSSLDLQQSNYLFTLLGDIDSMANAHTTGETDNIRSIDTIVKVTGMNLGNSVNVPVKFVKIT